MSDPDRPEDTSRDAWHKAEYDRVRREHKPDALEWETLTREQRDNIRKINSEHRDWMNNLGNAIRNGTSLPPLTGGRK